MAGPSLRLAAQGGFSMNIVMIGAGLASVRAAEELRAQGFSGSITIVGAESHPPYERPPLSKDFLGGDVPIESLALQPES
jgi:3-phenylpropionate/trans-cinnamate dioxygenase ferredoxin reductase subunit